MPKQKGMKVRRQTSLIRELRTARQALGPRSSGKVVNSTVSKATRIKRRFF